MFKEEVYINRRKKLKEIIGSGILFFPGNTDAAFNYPANIYSFRQDSSFLYFFGLDQPDLAGIIDADSGEDYIFGNDFDMDDIIWMGEQASVKERAENVGVKNTGSIKDLMNLFQLHQKNLKKYIYSLSIVMLQ